MFIAYEYMPAFISASIAQWLEHWSCKPGVVSSILTGGSCFSRAHTGTWCHAIVISTPNKNQKVAHELSWLEMVSLPH